MGINPVNLEHQKRAVFLDRDGVVNNAIIRDGKPYPPASLDEIIINPGVKEGLDLLKKLGFLLIVITNQPDVSRERTTRESVETINTFLMENLPLDEILVCYHDNQDNCDCRKPKPGQILKAAQLFNIDLSKSFMIGDRWSDIEAGKRAGCKTLYIDNGYIEKRPESPDFLISSFGKSVEIIKGTC